MAIRKGFSFLLQNIPCVGPTLDTHEPVWMQPEDKWLHPCSCFGCLRRDSLDHFLFRISEVVHIEIFGAEIGPAKLNAFTQRTTSERDQRQSTLSQQCEQFVDVVNLAGAVFVCIVPHPDVLWTLGEFDTRVATGGDDVENQF